ncbi:MAG: hypothetical protein U0271_39590 [Polyangiaceae bacterium]
MSPKRELEDFIAALKVEFPNFKLIPKRESPLSRAIDLALKIATFGQQREFMSRYYTVIGDRLYLPDGFDDADPRSVIVTLRHERVHLLQRRRLTFLGMALVYLLLPFPVGLAYGRARLEWEAYRETLRATLELFGEDALRSAALRTRIVSQFTSAAYLWMWPFKGSVERWYDEALEELLTPPTDARSSSSRRSARSK